MEEVEQHLDECLEKVELNSR